MATNWAKDGLDAYLSLTGEHRAQQKADSDEANRKLTTDLAIKQDARAEATAGLTNQLTQQGLDKGKREAEDNAKWDVIPPDLVDFSRKSLVNNPFTLNKDDMADPVKYQRSVSLHKNVIGLVDKLNSLPPTVEKMFLTKEQIAAMSPQDQLSIKYISGLGSRNGARSGNDGTVTGDTAALMLVRDKQSGKWGVGQEVGVAVDGGGNRTAPITNGTDDPAAAVKFIPIDSFASNAQSILAGTEKALASGADPTESILQEQLAKAQAEWLATPLELRKKITEDHRALQKNLKIRESDVETTKAVAAKIEELQPQIDALNWTDARGAATKLRSILGKAGMTAVELDKAEKTILSSKLPKDVKYTRYETGDGVYAVNDNDPTDRKRIGSPTKVPGGSGDGNGQLPADAKMIEYYTKKLGLTKEEALQRVGGAKESPAKLIIDTFNHLKAGQVNESPTITKTDPKSGERTTVNNPLYKSNEDLMKEAEGFVNKYLIKTTVNKPADSASPQSQGIIPKSNMSGGSLQEDVNYLRGGGNKPSSSTGQRLGLYFQ